MELDPKELSIEEYITLDARLEEVYSKLEALTKVEKPVEKPIEEEIKPELKNLEEQQQKIFDEIEVMRSDKASGLEIDQTNFYALEK